MSSTEFRLTVAASSPASIEGPSLKTEVAMVKLALLLGSKVLLYSPATSMLRAIHASAGPQEAERIMTEYAAHPASGPEGDRLLRAYVDAKRSKPYKRTEDQIRVLSVANTTLQNLRRISRQLMSDAGYDDLRLAEHEGLLEIQDLGMSEFISPAQLFLHEINKVPIDITPVIPSLKRNFEEVLFSGTHYPLLDETIANDARSHPRHSEMTQPVTQRATLPAFSQLILNGLPVATTPMERILEIREKLGDAAIGFRSEVARLCATATSAPWTAELDRELEHIFHTLVSPQIHALRRSLRREEVRKLWLIPAGALAATGLGAGFGLSLKDPNLDYINALVSALGAGVGGTVAALASNYITHSKSTERSPWYFYYRAEEQLLI